MLGLRRVGMEVRAMTETVHVTWSPGRADVSAADWLDETERGRFERLRKVEDLRAFLTSRMLLKTMVGRLADTPPELVRLSYHRPRCGRSHGRPVVVAPHAAVGWHPETSPLERAAGRITTGKYAPDMPRAH